MDSAEVIALMTCSIKRHAVFRLALVLMTSLSIVGCAEAPKPLYHWNGFERQLYNHFKNDSAGPEEQLRNMNAQVEKAQAGGKALPPGFFAHMAMLCLRLGRDGEAKLHLEAEKARFPESAPYMDFLLKRMTAPQS